MKLFRKKLRMKRKIWMTKKGWSTHWRFLDDTSCMIDSKKRGLLQILPQVLVLYVCSLSICAHTISSSCSLCALSFWFSPLVFCVPLLFFMCAFSLSICAHTISSHGLCSALRPLRGLPLLFFVSSLSFWFAPLVLCVLF